MIMRTVYCCVPGCGRNETEKRPNDGWPGWGQLSGVVVQFDDRKIENPTLCSEHKRVAATVLFGDEVTD